jgi:GxxExxY protein
LKEQNPGNEGDPRTYAIIGAAMEVHRILGPGHLEAVYQHALRIELELRGVPVTSKPKLTLSYKGQELDAYYVPDFVAYDSVVVEIKAQTMLTSLDDAQLLNSMKCAGHHVGLLINFGELSLKWKRLVSR